jgi:hypothetical protein
MANINAPFGLRAIGENGGMYEGATMLCNVPSSQASNLFLGDPVVALGGCDAYGCPVIGIATAGAGNAVLGSIISISNGPAAGNGTAAFTVTRDLPVYRQGAISNYVVISQDPNFLFAIQEDSVGGAIAAGTAGFANGNLVSGAGSTVTGFSGWMLQSSSVDNGAGTTRQLKILGLLRGPDNAIGTYARWIVRLNNGQLWSNTGV